MTSSGRDKTLISGLISLIICSVLARPSFERPMRAMAAGFARANEVANPYCISSEGIHLIGQCSMTMRKSYALLVIVSYLLSKSASCAGDDNDLACLCEARLCGIDSRVRLCVALMGKGSAFDVCKGIFFSHGDFKDLKGVKERANRRGNGGSYLYSGGIAELALTPEANGAKFACQGYQLITSDLLFTAGNLEIIILFIVYLNIHRHPVD